MVRSIRPSDSTVAATAIFVCCMSATTDAQGDDIAAGVVELTPTGVDGGGAIPGLEGYTTYNVEIRFDSSRVSNMYTIYGDEHATLDFPPCYQVPAPFGSNVGPTKAAFWQFKPEAQYDSWLTVGATLAEGAHLSSIGIPFGDWSETTGLSVNDGAAFYMDPAIGPAVTPDNEIVVVAQLTVPTTSSQGIQLRFSAQGKSVGGQRDWDDTRFVYPPAGSTTPPPTPVPTTPTGTACPCIGCSFEGNCRALDEKGVNPTACESAGGTWCDTDPTAPLDGHDATDEAGCATCGILGWATEGGDPEVCAESDAGFDCSRSVTFTQAQTTCSQVGARLCTATELMIGEGQGTGCGHDGHLIWSGSRKLYQGVSAPVKCRLNQRIVVAGTDDAATPPVCVDTTAIHGPYGRPGLAVRCCADLECAGDAGPPPGPPLPEHPCRTCEDLHWATEDGDPEVCGESDDGIQCTTGVDFAHAAATCNSIGTRLCTATELKLGEGRNTGCNHNSRMIWSGSSFLDDLYCDTSERVAVSGSAADGASYEEPACVAMTDGSQVAVRCCADIECPNGH